VKFSSQQIRALERENLRWGTALEPIPADRWPPETEQGTRRVAVLRNRKFLVQVFDECRGAKRLTVSRTEWDRDRQRWKEGISWDDLQRLKSEAGFAASWAVELFPPDDEVVNVASMRHLWLVGDAPAFAWRTQRRAA
jgi:hypothetical protein